MRKLIFAMSVSIDGCCDHTKAFGVEDVHDYFARLTRNAEVLVYGRKTYQLMVPFWPNVAQNNSGDSKAVNNFARAFVAVPQIIVFSKSLKKIESKNTIIIRGRLQSEILELKRKKGKDILTGGVALPSQLMKLGLVDEIRLVIHPVVVGKGRRLFDDLTLRDRFRFKLVESKKFKMGTLALRYVKK